MRIARINEMEKLFDRVLQTQSAFEKAVEEYRELQEDVRKLEYQKLMRREIMRFLGNIIWIICGGLISAIGWWLVGIVWCCTVVGIPVGVQCFKLSSISLNPFGKEVVDEGGAVSLLLNILWVCLSGIELAAANALIGLILCVTIIGIPFGKQFFKIARVALFPFGAKVVRVHF